MKLIETKTLGTAAASIVFSGISQDFTDLCVLFSLRGASDDSLFMSVNGSGANLSRRDLFGTGSASGSSNASDGFLGQMGSSTFTANTFGSQQLYIPNYTASTAKSYSVDSVNENNATAANIRILAGLWNNTAAITSLTFTCSGNFAAGSTASLYGIGGVADGYAPKATGGEISFVNGYWVHTFTSSGTFTANQNLSNVEYLVIAGGGGGAYDRGGGGGAGGYRSSVVGESSGGGASAESRISVASGNHTVIVGAGGAGGNSSNANGSIGVASSFGTISTVGGGPACVSVADITGGSGGGGFGQDIGFGLDGGLGTANQGFAGGNGTGFNTYHPGGGGGAGSVGVNGSSLGAGGGGAGVGSSITGVSVLRAGGAGGGRNWNGGGSSGLGRDGGGNGGAGGGGAAATSGTVNTGGGGGGGGNNPQQNGAAGGSGIVIVRYAA